MSGTPSTQQLLRPLELLGGGYAMLALDQRESLRRMFPPIDGKPVGDQTLRDFKSEALNVLTPFASGVLVDRPYTATDARPAGLAESCGLILAADVLDQPAGMPVVDTWLDPLVTTEFIRHVGAVAIKYLVIWRDDDERTRRGEGVRKFVDLAKQAGVASLVEGIVRPAGRDDWTDAAARHRAILAAAEDLSSYGGSIYKAEVPGYLPGDLSLVREQSHQLSGRVGGPWVVLSNGVELADFAGAVREACLGGASGFLAGRAIWSDTVGEVDIASALGERSRDRLQQLTEIVAESVGSWTRPV